MIRKKEELRFGNLFRGSVEEFSDKFVVILKSFLFIYFIPVLVLGFLFIAAMIVSYPTVGISGNAISEASFGGFSFGEMFSAENLNINATAVILIGIVFGIISILLTILLNLAYIHIGFSKVGEGFSGIWNKTRETFWKYFGFSVVMVIFLGVLYLLFIIPGIIFTVYWIFAAFVLINEKKGIIESLRMSKNMVKGRWWKVFGHLILLFLILAAASIIVSFVPFVGGFISTLVITPFATLFLKNFYFGMRK